MEDLRQDEDCLDTWFSSRLWPISLFDGINNPVMRKSIITIRQVTR